jgi:hypothetical protein
MAEMKGTRPQWAFIQAVQAQGNSDWSGQHFALMIGCKEDDKPPPTLEGLINRYHRWVSTKRLYTKALGSFAAQEATQATLAITEPKPKPRPSKMPLRLLSQCLEVLYLEPKVRGSSRRLQAKPEGYTRLP